MMQGRSHEPKVKRSSMPSMTFINAQEAVLVAMEAVNIPVDYSFMIDMDEARNLQRISLKFVPEHELETFLRPYL